MVNFAPLAPAMDGCVIVGFKLAKTSNRVELRLHSIKLMLVNKALLIAQ